MIGKYTALLLHLVRVPSSTTSFPSPLSQLFDDLSNNYYYVYTFFFSYNFKLKKLIFSIFHQHFNLTSLR